MIVRLGVFPGVLFVAGLAAPQVVELAATPQKFVTFYSPGASEVPAELTSSPPAPLPAGGVQAVAVATDGAVWLGTAKGLIRYHPGEPAPSRRQYFAGRRYLPGDNVRNLHPGPSADMWVLTAAGVAHIELRPMTLAVKAEYFERRIRARHDRYGLVAGSTFTEPGNPATNRLTPSDNDGLWTAVYAAAECFRFAVTRSSEALANARKSIEALLFLEQVTGRPGFPARSYIRRGDWRPADGIWHWTSDGRHEWKADTSSDEIVGHFFLFAVAAEHLPDAALKARIAAAAGRIMDHILDHGYHLTDVNGKPTTWGRWSPSYFATPTGKPDSPLNALELLSFLKTAHRLTGRARYLTEYRKAAVEMKYAELTARLLELREELNYSDEQLALLSFYPLFQYESDPVLLGLYRRALDQWWENIQREQNPLGTFLYLTARPEARVDLAGAVHTLYRIPMDLIHWTVTNSHRGDVEWDPAPDRFGRRQARTLLPPDERPVMKWNGNPFRVEGGSGGGGEDDGSFFLLPYWLGRYHGFLAGE